MKFETLIFDMDGVVIDSEVLFDNADTQFFNRHGNVFNREEVSLLLMGMHLREGTALLKKIYNFDGDVDSLMAERQSLLEAEYNERLSYIVGFENFFNKVIAAGLKTCIATSSNDYLLEIAIKKLSLDKKFGPDIFKSSDVGNVSKPNPAIFIYAAEKMETQPAKCIVIEDSPKGILAAKNAGMFCIGITTSFAKDRLNEADFIIDSYEEVDLGKLLA